MPLDVRSPALGALLVHTSPLLEALGARTRFQAALLASERGWVG